MIEKNDNVAAWVKNDHLGFYINYVFEGRFFRYIPDFLIKLKNGHMLILEVKGKETEKDKVKRQYLDEWVEAVNETREYGVWHSDCVYLTPEIASIIEKYCGDE